MASERLDIVGTFKDGISPGLKKVGETAKQTDKEIEKITSVDLTQWGSGMLRGARSLATGLYGLASASSDLAEAQNFANQIFKEAAPAVSKFAKGAATAIGLSERAALDAAASLGIFGQKINLTGDDLATFSTDLVTLAGDMASVKNTKVEDAVTAIAAAMRGEYEPIRRYGVVLGDVALKARAAALEIYDGSGQLNAQQKIIAVNAELYDQLGFAIGDFQRTQGELANQTRIAQAQFENLQASLGDALRPAFIQLTGAANSALDTLQRIPAPIKTIGSTLGLVATGVLGLGGAFFWTAGKIGGVISNFRDLRLRMNEMRATGGTATKAIMGIGTALGYIGAAVAGTELLIGVFNEISDVSGKTQRSIEGITIALGKMDTKGAVEAFSELVKTENQAGKLSGLWEDFGRTFEVEALGIKSSVENMDDAFNKLTTEQQGKMIEAFKELLPTLEKGSDDFKNLTDIINRYEPRVKSTVQSQQALNATHGLSAETVAQFGDETLDATDAIKAEEEAVKAAEEAHKAAVDTYKDAANALDEMRGSLQEANAAFDMAAEQGESFTEAMEKVAGTPQWLDNVVSFRNAMHDLTESFKDADGNIDKATMTLDFNTEAGRKNIQAVDELAGIIGDELSRVFVDTGGNIEEVNRVAEEWRGELGRQLAAVGMNTDQINEYLNMLGLTPEQITTIVKLKDQDLAMKRLEMLNLEMDKIPPDIATKILASVNQGDFITAYNTASNYITGAGPLEIQAMADQASAAEAGADAAAEAQVSATEQGAIDIDAAMGDVIGIPSAMAKAQAQAAEMPPSVDMKVEPGDVATPVKKNQAYAKTNQPETEIKTEPGDYQGPWRTIDGYMKSHQPTTTVKTLPGAYAATWLAIALYFATRPVTLTVNTDAGNIGATWSEINSYFRNRPVTVNVNADAGNLGAAWSQIQTYFNNHPITVKVNTVAGRTSVPNIPPGVTGLSQGRAARPTAEESAMQTMGLTAAGETLYAAPAPVTAGAMAPTSTPAIINLSVNMPVGTNETKVVDLLRRYQRSNGRPVLTRR